jgi:histidine decarboxylase
VVLKTPPAAVAARWMLASSGGLSHVVCVPGVERGQIDEFIADLAVGVEVPVGRPVEAPVSTPTIPRQRRAHSGVVV